jgi:hypothetical protein
MDRVHEPGTWRCEESHRAGLQDRAPRSLPTLHPWRNHATIPMMCLQTVRGAVVPHATDLRGLWVRKCPGLPEPCNGRFTSRNCGGNAKGLKAHALTPSRQAK